LGLTQGQNNLTGVTRMIKSKHQLTKWINEYGMTRLAHKLGVDVSTVSYWSKGRYVPSDRNKEKLIKLTGNQIQFGKIIAEHMRENN
jgi:ribosome-binding protein aMBF1 (putative translation factor)